MSQQKKWLDTFWRWFLEAIDNEQWSLALRMAKCIENLNNVKGGKSRG